MSKNILFYIKEVEINRLKINAIKTEKGSSWHFAMASGCGSKIFDPCRDWEIFFAAWVGPGQVSQLWGLDSSPKNSYRVKKNLIGLVQKIPWSLIPPNPTKKIMVISPYFS